MQNHDRPERTVHSSFFVLNVWEDALGDGRTEWRGEILDVDNNAVRTFADWPEVVEIIADTLQKLRPSDAAIQSIHAEGGTTKR